MLATQDGWISKYKQRGALWIHDGNSKRPHALLTSGKHSDGFFNSELVMEDSALLAEACSNLLHKLEIDEGVSLSKIDRVVGPAMGAITMAHEMARQISEGTGHRCLRAYTEKFEKMMVFQRTTIKPTELILLVEDVLTTGGSVEITSAAVAATFGYILPFTAVLVNRSGFKEVGGKKIVALIDRPMPVWASDDCPLCKNGSEAIRPKGTENWKRLNAYY